MGKLQNDLTSEKELSSTEEYSKYLASYISQGLKIYGLLTVPKGEKPKGGWPVIIFNHGYIPLNKYSTERTYGAYVDGFAKAGFIVFKPDYRGHDLSDKDPKGEHDLPVYIEDALSALAAIKSYSEINPEKIGMWGHSMGTQITISCMTKCTDIKAGVLWANAVVPFDELVKHWEHRMANFEQVLGIEISEEEKQRMIKKWEERRENGDFWRSIDPTKNLDKICGPLQLHHGTLDKATPLEFAQILTDLLKKEGKEVELFTYQNTDHNMQGEFFDLAMERSVNFFDHYLKLL